MGTSICDLCAGIVRFSMKFDKYLIQSILAIRNILVALKLFLNAKSSLSLWSKWQIGHGKWFLNINLFLIKQFLIAKNFVNFVVKWYNNNCLLELFTAVDRFDFTNINHSLNKKLTSPHWGQVPPFFSSCLFSICTCKCLKYWKIKNSYQHIKYMY